MSARVLLIIALIFAIPLLFIKGCQSLTHTIYWSMDCDQFNIDHIEVRTGIDIPKVTTKKCSLTEKQRITDFNIELDEHALSAYANKHFTFIDSLYFASGVQEHHLWFATLDTANSVLHFELQYLQP